VTGGRWRRIVLGDVLAGRERNLKKNLARFRIDSGADHGHSLKVPSHDQPGAVEIEREGEGVQREYGRDGVDKVLAPAWGWG
jgi:hypothetical protein